MVIDSKLICHVMEIALVQEVVALNYYSIRPIFTVRTRFRTNKQNLELAFCSDSSLKACAVGILLVYSWFSFCCDSIGFLSDLYVLSIVSSFTAVA